MLRTSVKLSFRSAISAPKSRGVFTRLLAIAITVLLATTTTKVFAGPHIVDNPSFETNVLADAASTTDTIFAWSGTGTFGAINPTSSQYIGADGNSLPGPGTDGANLAYINGSSTIFQSLTLTLTPSTTYLLTGAVGDPSGSTYGSAFAELVAGSTVLTTLNISDPGAGNFATWTLTYSSLASQPELGQTLEIVLGNSASGAGSVVNFDNIGLNTQPAPEPAFFSLALLAISGLAARRLIQHRRTLRQ